MKFLRRGSFSVKWLEVAVTVDPEYQEMVSQVLLDQGVQGLEIVDPYAFRQVLDENRYLDYADDGLIESYGEKVIIKAYFSTDRDAEKLKSTLNDEFMRFLGLIPGYTLRIRDDSEWKDNWKKYYKTFKIFERVVIKPTWEDYSKTGDEVIVELEPEWPSEQGLMKQRGCVRNFLTNL